jgi:SAM-dependent methyltransferase
MSGERHPDCFDEYAETYEAAVRQGVRLSGETPEFFAQARVQFLVRELRRRGSFPHVRRILDYGCGTGGTSRLLQAAFPCVEVVGVDSSAGMIREACSRNAQPSLRFEELGSPPRLRESGFDLVYSCNVFHHIDPVHRPATLRALFDCTAAGGYLALVENNPWNPGTRAVMARVSFDRDAVPLNPSNVRKLTVSTGFHVSLARSLFFFPRFLAGLRFLEPMLAPLPLGAQYAVLARKAPL